MNDERAARKRSFTRFADTRKRVQSLYTDTRQRKRTRADSYVPKKKDSHASYGSGHTSRPRFRSSMSMANIDGGNARRMSLMSIASNAAAQRRASSRTRSGRRRRRNTRMISGGPQGRFSIFQRAPKRPSILEMRAVVIEEEKPKWEERETLEGWTYYWNNEDQDFQWDKPQELWTDKEKAEQSSEWIWFPHLKNYWQPAQIMEERADGSISVKLQTNNKFVTVPKLRIMKKAALTGGDTQRVNVKDRFTRNLLDNIVEDLVDLDHVSEGSILHNTRIRYEEGKIYTWIGANRQVLLAINPYEDLGLYTKEQMDFYATTANAVTTPPPHVFGVAAACLDSLANINRNQSILVSGESGSGKTQATKQCLDYLTHVAGSQKETPPANAKGKKKGGGRRRRRQMPGEGPTVVKDIKDKDSIEEKIMVANPVLEAFGNAKTTRNNNSSRFGKWIAVYFSANGKKISGAKIDNFLLETTRVIFQAQNERNYHIFYELFTDEELRDKFNLTYPQEYRILNAGNCTTVRGINDEKEFVEVKEAMGKLKFEDDEKEWIFRTVAALIHLGNVEFEVGHDKKVHVTNEDALQMASELLEISTEDVAQVLTERTLRTSKDVLVKPRSLSGAGAARDSLAKATYNKLFDYIVERINESFESAKGRLIGILDIFGFELFETNSFEQLCINYTNEKLQKLFNDDTFEEEQELYKQEGIKYEKIKFDSNEGIISMIGNNSDGIFSLLDDQGLSAKKGSDEAFLQNIVAAHDTRGPKVFKGDVKGRTFTVNHFAGKVTYTIDGFMDKNLDRLNQDLYEICSKSQDPLTQYLFPKMNENDRFKSGSTSRKFRDELKDLMALLTETQSHYIRCIKPNKEQTPGNFNGRKSIKQLLSAGVINSVKLRQKGFPYRILHEDFVQVYKNVNGPNVKYTVRESDSKGMCKQIVEHCFQRRPRKLLGIQIGNLYVLFRREEFRFLELSRTLAFAEYLPRVQAQVRGFLARQFYSKLKEASDALQEAVKEGDMDAIEQIEEELPQKLGRLGDLYGMRPKRFESARREVEKMRRWDPVREELQKYEEYTENSDVSSLTEEELEDLMKRILVLEEVGKMPDDVHDGYDHIKELIKRVHRSKLADQEFLEILKPKDEVDPQLLVTVEEFAVKEEEKEAAAIEADAIEAVENVKDRETLRNIVLKAEEIDYSSEAIEKAKEYLALPEVQFVGLQYRSLLEKEGSAEASAATREKLIRLKELELASQFDQYKYIYSYPGFLEPPQWTNPILCCLPSRMRLKESDLVVEDAVNHRRANRIRKNLIWQPFVIDSPVLKLPRENHEEAKYLFSGLMSFMEEDDSDHAGLDLINTGIRYADIRDEIFAQIVKQVQDNPDGTSVVKGIEILGLALACFVPSDPEFTKYLYVWMRCHLPYGIFRHYMSAAHNAEYSPVTDEFVDFARVQERLDSTSSGSRHSSGWESDPWDIPSRHIKNVFEDYGLDETDGFFADFESEEEREKRDRLAGVRKQLSSTLSRLSTKLPTRKSRKNVRLVQVQMESITDKDAI